MSNYEDYSKDPTPAWGSPLVLARRLTSRLYDPFTIERDIARLIAIALALVVVVLLLRGCGRASALTATPAANPRQHQDG